MQIEAEEIRPSPTGRGLSIGQITLAAGIPALVLGFMSLFGVFAQAKQASKRTAGLSNIKQLGVALAMYTADNDDIAPPANFSDSYPVAHKLWGGGEFDARNVCLLPDRLYPYLKSDEAFVDPEFSRPLVRQGGKFVTSGSYAYICGHQDEGELNPVSLFASVYGSAAKKEEFASGYGFVCSNALYSFEDPASTAALIRDFFDTYPPSGSWRRSFLPARLGGESVGGGIAGTLVVFADSHASYKRLSFGQFLKTLGICNRFDDASGQCVDEGSSAPSRTVAPGPNADRFKGPSPIAPSSTPIAQGTTPSAPSSTPIAQGTTPSAQGPTPSAQGPTPSAQSTTPGAQSTTPSAQSTTPSAQSTTPSAQGVPPSAQRPRPIAQSLQPSAHRLPPSARRLPPSAQLPTPIAQSPTPIAQRPTPIADRLPPSAQRLPPSADRLPPGPQRLTPKVLRRIPHHPANPPAGASPAPPRDPSPRSPSASPAQTTPGR